MNILFLTLSNVESLDNRGIYIDLVRCFARHGHYVCLVSPSERRYRVKTNIVHNGNISLLKVNVGNLKKCSIFEKGISTLMLGKIFSKAISNHCNNKHFDLILYSTPPITFSEVVRHLKKIYKAKTYLLLKDIFPQNALDMGLMTNSGIRSVIYKYFKKRENELYDLSDFIGCMSQENINYLIRNEPMINQEKLHVNPNSIEIEPLCNDQKKREHIRRKFGIPLDVRAFVYGGNLGIPQGIPFIIDCLKINANRDDRYFVICGEGTEFFKLTEFMKEVKPNNILILNGMPRAEYELFIKAFDIGLIFLDHRFTIPNFPSRLLSYLQNGMPVLACTDRNTDIGKTIIGGEFGWWCESNDALRFTDIVTEACNTDISLLREQAFRFLIQNYSVENSYQIIMKRVKE